MILKSHKIALLKIFFLLIAFSAAAQENKSFSVYLIGDAGEDTVPGKALLMLKDQLLSNPNSAVIFLGDNVYPAGLNGNHISILHLESQLQILKNYSGQAFFIPGNHDWHAEGPKGLKTLKNEQEYVELYLKNNSSATNKNEATFLPKNGLPGPETVMLTDKVRIIFIDTQWFLHFYKKNKVGTKAHTKELFYFHLDSLLSYAKQNKEQVIITAHHPMFTNGEHSRNAQPARFLINYTPFKILGWLGLDRVLSQDLKAPHYKKMRTKMLQSIDKYDNIIYASGHDHNLQFFNQGTNHYVVSGCGSKLSPLQKKKKFDSLFQDDTKTGFVKIEYQLDGSHSTIIYRVGEKEKLLVGF
jgi:calcineurin-like phosphoesterase family protein